ncbi:MAG: iron chaperone [Micrococcales bacterium]
METVEEYYAAQPEINRVALKRVQGIIEKTLGECTVSLSYQIIGFRYKKKFVTHISGWKDHLSFHGFSVSLGNELVAKYPEYLKLKGRTLHFQPQPEIPEEMVRELVQARVAEIGL